MRLIDIVKIRSKKTIIILSIALLIIGLFVVLNTLKKTVYATSQETIKNDILNIKEETNEINLYEIIKSNNNISEKEEIIVEEIDLEYTTKYQNSSELAKGSLQVLQEGRTGKRQVKIKNTYNEAGELINTEEIESRILKASIDKIVSVGTANYKNKYKPKQGDKLYVTPSSVSVRLEPDLNAEKVITINQEEEVTLLEVNKEWYKISYKNYTGWVEANCLKTETIKQEESAAGGASKSKLLKNLSINMALNKPSGLSLEQFKKVLSKNPNDKNKVFQNNAEYFYYAEKQYNVNGIFVAAVGIHESGWGTSKISLNKKNLFGYGAYDRSPYSSSYSFSSYSEGIDLIARVFVKYYLNPAGTKIYNGETASGKYYSGNTLSAVNKKYASDKNWANKVYKYMSELYNAI